MRDNGIIVIIIDID